MTNTATLLERTPTLPANGKGSSKEHTCVVNIGLYRSGTTPLAEAFSKLDLKAYSHFPSLPPDHLKKILQDPQAAVQDWYSTVGLNEILKLVSEHAYICDGWVALLPFLNRSALEEIELQARAASIQIKFVSTSRSVDETVKSELQHWVIHDLERQSELSFDERCRLEDDLRIRAIQHQCLVKYLCSLGLVKLLPLSNSIQENWPGILSTITDSSALSWSKVLKDVGVCNSTPSLPIAGILVTMRLQRDNTDVATSSIKRLLGEIEKDHICRYLLVLGIDADERNSDSAAAVIQHLNEHMESSPQMHSFHLVTNPPRQLQGEPFAICRVWDQMAVEAWTHGADWVVLLGDDIEITCPFHHRAFYRSFLDISNRINVPFGFGCPFWNDISFPGFPTFPCVGKIHFKIFGGLIPEHRRESFVNQDLGPYLHHLYLKLGATTCVTDATLRNGVGGNIGSSEARYSRIHARGWRDFVLEDYRTHLLPFMPEGTPQYITVDVVVPSFRVRLDYLRSICHLKVPAMIRTNFIIIIDNIDALLRAARDLTGDGDITISQAEDILERHLAMSGNAVRVRCNDSNLGASASRNRGINESAAEFILNLDDDLIPDEDLLEQYGRKLSQIDDTVAGLVGLVRFPRTPDMPLRHAAVLMSYLTFMFEIAEQESNMYTPAWGVTANILFRRTNIRFDPIYAKTGGGEDVDYSLRVTEACNGGRLLAVPEARVVHPFWAGSVFALASHFHNWAIGDGALFQIFPEHTYWSFPNLPETILFTLPLCCLQMNYRQYFQFVSFSIAADFVVDLVCDDYQHRIAVVQGIGKDRVKEKRGHLFYFFAHVLANLFILGLEFGRLRGHIVRCNFAHGPFRRFDWHIGRLPNAPNNFRKREAHKFCFFVAILSSIWYCA
mmetsp:Transcript_22222/g.44688  ORF Transcript_22222/g.44688 Transcript_22222/m.44688 type:complete len:897 (+) Transcript_22222:1143-3833(+)